MRVFTILASILVAASAANADRFVMKDDTVREGKLAGMQADAFLVNIQGRVYAIPVASVSLVVFDNAQPQTSAVQPPPPPAGVPSRTYSSQDFRPVNPGSPVNPVAPIVSAFSQTLQGFKVDLDRCTKQGSKAVICNFKITNQQNDRPVSVTGSWNTPSYYVDDRGMQRNAETAQLGTSQGSRAETASVTDVPIRGNITFPGVEVGVNSLAKLVIVLPSPGFSVEFRKVPLLGN